VRIVRVAVVSAVMALGSAMVFSALSTQVAGAQTPSTQVIDPASGATVPGTPGPGTQVVLDATASAGVSRVQFELSGGLLNDWVIATATPTIYGWVAEWNSAAVANGTYTLQSVATADGSSATSPGISITVLNGSTQLTIAVPPSGATVSGTQVVLDALGPAGLTEVFFYYYARTCPPSGGGEHPQDICVINATFTPWGYVALWDSTSVPDGSYGLFANCGGGQCSGPTASSPIDVDNPAVATPANGARVTGSQGLDCVPPAGYGGVEFWLEGGGLSAPQELGNGTLTWIGWLYGWNTTSVVDGVYSLYCTAVSPSGRTVPSFANQVIVAN
jgi:Bacterial Ig domain